MVPGTARCRLSFPQDALDDLGRKALIEVAAEFDVGQDTIPRLQKNGDVPPSTLRLPAGGFRHN